MGRSVLRPYEGKRNTEGPEGIPCATDIQTQEHRQECLCHKT